MANITVDHISPGVVQVTIRSAAYPQVGEHWRRVLSGNNTQRWGRIWTDPDAQAADERRADAMWEEGQSTRGMPHANRDECPGAMFIWETQEISDVEVCCASANQAFGRDLYNALRPLIRQQNKNYVDRRYRNRLSWWEVKFNFI